MDLLFATNNRKKLELMKQRLREIPIIVKSPKELDLQIAVKEDGKTAEENAILKLKAYYAQKEMAIIAEDSALYIEKFPKEKQPGLFVRRIEGREDATDEEMLSYYRRGLEKIGGQSIAYYETGIALINEIGEIRSITIKEKPFLMTNKIEEKETLQGGILDKISIDLESGKYFNKLSEDEKARRYEKLNEEIKKLVKEVLLQ